MTIYFKMTLGMLKQNIKLRDIKNVITTIKLFNQYLQNDLLFNHGDKNAK